MAPTAAESDGLSTAFMVLSPDEVERYCGLHPQVSGMLLRDPPDRGRLRFGVWETDGLKLDDLHES